MSRLSLGIYGFFLALFILLSYLAHQFVIFPGDIAVSLWLRGINHPFLNLIMPAVSYIASTIPATVIVVLVGGGLWAAGRKFELIFVASVTSLAALINWLLKLLINRPRPGDLTVTLTGSGGLSFPSGHTVYAIVFYGVLFYLIPKLTKQPFVVTILRSALVLLILLTGASRVYLGAHWPSDILGSLLLSGLVLAPAITFYHNYAKRYQIKLAEENARTA